MSDSSRWPPTKDELQRLLRALTHDQVARAFEVTVDQVFDLERDYGLGRRAPGGPPRPDDDGKA